MRVSGLCASWGHLILLKGSIARLDTRQRKFEPILIITEAKNAHFFVYKQTGFVHQRLRYFVKMTLTGVSCDWLWLESSRTVKNVTLIESPFFSTWLESSPSHQKPVLESSRITLQLQMSVIDWWKKLNKQYESNFFSPERTGNVETMSNNPLNIRFVAKTSDIRNYSQNIRSDVDVEASEVATRSHSKDCNIKKTKRETNDASESRPNQASWKKTVLKFCSENQIHFHNFLSILFGGFPMIAWSGKSDITISMVSI